MDVSQRLFLMLYPGCLILPLILTMRSSTFIMTLHPILISSTKLVTDARYSGRGPWVPASICFLGLQIYFQVDQ